MISRAFSAFGLLALLSLLFVGNAQPSGAAYSANPSIATPGCLPEITCYHTNAQTESFLAAIAQIRVETRSTIRNGDDEFADLSFGDHAVHDLIRLAARAPTRFVFKQSMEEVEDGIFLGWGVVIRRRQIDAVLQISTKQFARERFVLDVLSKNLRAEQEQ